jgi:hypothetical protein
MPKLCEFETCRSRATYGINCDPIKCFEHKEDNMKLSSGLCKCGKKFPNFNFEGLKPKFCVNCKTFKMVNVKKTRCFCGKSQPIYNFEGFKPEYCASCKLDNMMNVVDKRCICNKSIARYNFEGLKPEYCASCKLDNMMNIVNKRCVCKKTIARYNFEGYKPEYCASCKLDNNMIDLISKKCECGKSQPSFNYEGLKPKYCSNCRLDGMQNVKYKMCFCKLSYPTFNFEGLKPEYCSKCKSDTMINVKHNKCYCGKVIPTFNYEGLQAEYCMSCKSVSMVNVKDDKCKADTCQTTANKNYKGYCASCFQHLFPLDPLTFQIRCKTKEIAVRDFINTKFGGFYHDKPLWYNETACDCTTKRKIDHRKLINATLLCIETDENQHKSYSKQDEEARYNDLFMAYGGKFIFIRFNPDKYKDENGKSSNPMLFNRLIVLEEEINKQIKRIENDENKDLLEVIELYYDKK